MVLSLGVAVATGVELALELLCALLPGDEAGEGDSEGAAGAEVWAGAGDWAGGDEDWLGGGFVEVCVVELASGSTYCWSPADEAIAAGATSVSAPIPARQLRR